MDPDTGTATSTAAGVLTLDELKGAAKDIWSHPDFAGATMLWDLHEATFPFTADEVVQFANFAKAGSTLRAPARAAIIVSCDFEFGLARMFQAHREEWGIQVRVFRDHLRATDWLRGDESPLLGR